MSEFVISLEGKLEENKTTKNIQDGLKKVVVPKINEKESLKVIASLNERSTTAKIKQQLKTISKNLNLEVDITPKVSDKNGKSVTKDITNQINQTSDLQAKATKKEIDIGEELNNILEKRYNIVKKTTTVNAQGKTITNTQYSDGLGVTTDIKTDSNDNVISKKYVDNIKSRQVATDKLTESIKTYTSQYEALKAKSSGGLLEGDENTNSFLKIMNEIDFSSFKKDLSELSNSELQTFFKELDDMSSKLRVAQAEFDKFNSMHDNKFKESGITNLNKEISELPDKVTAVEYRFKKLGTAIPSNVTTNIEQIRNDLAELEKVDDPTKRIAGYNQLKTKVAEVEEQYKKYSSEVRLTDDATKLLSDKKTFNNQITTWLNKNTKVSKEFRSQVLQLQSAIENADKVKLGQLKKEFQTLKSEASATDITNLNKEISELPDKVTAVEYRFKKLGTAIPTNVTTNIEQIRNDLVELEKVDDPTKRIAGYNQLKTKVAEVEKQYKKYSSEVRLADNATKLLSDKKTFNNQITTWLNENTKVSKEFRSHVLRLQSAIENADKVKLGQLKKEFQTLKSEASATGKLGRNMFDELKNNVKKFASWFAIGNFVSGITRNVRSAVTELKEIDTVLTEISKTSDRTTESLAKLGKQSFDAASQYGAKSSDYLKGVQEMSRAGYAEQNTEELAKLSTLAQSAGDMTAELANQYLIATDKAYDFSGSVEKLNATLDSQNYITNNNALNMEELANATKITASQADQAGIGIDEMTAAVGTMMAVTQQGGEVAGRAYKGLIMNLQQVTGELDDGEIIDSESLTKYEKASANLGVALKEVKDGVLVLRDPMVVLNDLAVAFNAEADDSIKKAELINAVGGKYRGNQLSALLSNWETYQKMLSEFNSEDAIGSAAEEAKKTADSWEGMINKLSNSWTELINNFANSDNAKTILNTANSFVTFLNDAVDKLGAIPTLITAIATAMVTTASIKNKGILKNDSLADIKSYIQSKKTAGQSFDEYNTISEIISGTADSGKITAALDKATESLNEYIETTDASELSVEGFYAANIENANGFKGVSQAIKTYTAVQGQGEKAQTAMSSAIGTSNKSLGAYLTKVGAGKASMGDYAASLVRATATTALLTAGTMALNMAMGMVASLAITGIIKGVSSLIHWQEREAEKTKAAAEEAKNKADAYKEETISIDNLISKYSEIISSSDDLSSSKTELISLQEELISQYGKEAENIDLVNGKYSETLDAIRKLRKEQAEQVMYDIGNKQYEKAKQVMTEKSVAIPSSMDEYGNLTVDNFVGNYNVLSSKKGRWTDTEEVAKILDKYSNAHLDNAENTIYVDGTIEERLETMKNLYSDLRSIYSDLDDDAKENKWLDDIQSQIKSVGETIDLYQPTYDEFNNALDIANQTDLSNEMQSKLDNYDSLVKKLSESTSSSDVIKYKTDVENLEKELINLAGDDDSLVSDLQTKFDSVSNVMQQAGRQFDSDSDILIEAFNKFNDETFDLTAKNIEKFNSALQTLSDGGSFDVSTVKELTDLNSDLAGQFKETADGYVIDSEKIVKARDKELQNAVDTIKSEIEANNKFIESTKKKIDVLNADILTRSTNAKGSYNNDDLKFIQDTKKEIKNCQTQIDEANKRTESWKQQQDLVTKSAQETKDAISADDYLSYQEKQLDKIVDKLSSEKNAQQEILDNLKAQKAEVEEIISNYETAASVVQSLIDKQTSALEDEKTAIENSYDERIESITTESDKRINALKVENDELDKSIKLQEKQKALRDAENNKQRVYSAARGFTVEVDTEAVTKAKNDLESFQNELEIDKLETDKSDKISALEKEKEAKTKLIDEQIKEWTNYKDSWQNTVDSIKNSDDELTASKILGSDWMEKITQKDTGVLNVFVANYANYQSQLKDTINKEIESQENAIAEKEKEIQAWTKHKDEYSNFVNSIKNKNDEHLGNLAQFNLDENSSFDERIANLNNFKENYVRLVNEINNNEPIKPKVDWGELYDNKLDSLLGENEDAAKNLFGSKTIDILKSIRGYSSGGVNDFTGIAALHGSQSKSEVVFNSGDAKKLYDLFHGNTSANIANAISNDVTGKLATNINNINNKSSGDTSNTLVYTFDGTINATSYPEFKSFMDRYTNETMTKMWVNNK